MFNRLKSLVIKENDSLKLQVVLYHWMLSLPQLYKKDPELYVEVSNEAVVFHVPYNNLDLVACNCLFCDRRKHICRRNCLFLYLCGM